MPLPPGYPTPPASIVHSTIPFTLTGPLRFPNANKASMSLLLSEVDKSLGRSIALNTLMTYVTPVSKVHFFVKDDLGVPLEELTTRSPPATWTIHEATWRLAVMMAFASKVSLTHNTVASTKRYVNQVSNHLSKHGLFVWARDHRISTQWDGFFRGLELRKN